MSADENLHLIEELADEFQRRQEAGEDVSISEFVAEHPNDADQLRDFIEALQLMHQLKKDEFKSSSPVSRPESRPGNRFPEIPDYRIIRELGRGAMGIVYEAEQLSLNRRVALKTMLHTGELRGKLRFQHEAKTAARLHHPAIVPVYDVGEAGGLMFYAMQFIEGCGLDAVLASVGTRLSDPTTPASSLQDVLADGLVTDADFSSSSTNVDLDKTKSDKTKSGDSVDLGHQASALLPPDSSGSTLSQTSNALRRSSQSASHRKYYRSIAKVGQRVASALAFAHEQGVIHRDIKPANLLLDKSGAIWVADFGLVKTNESELTQTGAFVGTLRYMAPERFEGDCDARSDVYSLGMTLYELLAQRPALDSTDKLTLLQQIRDADPPSLSSVTRRLPGDLEVIVSRAIQKDPKRRYASAQLLADDLERFLDGRPIKARQVSTTEKVLLWAKKHKALASSLAALLLLLVVGSIAATFAAVYFRSQGIKQTELASQNQTLAEEKVTESEKAIRQRDVARQNAYFADMRSANQDRLDGKVRRMLTTLRRYLPAEGVPGEDRQKDLRGWEWYHLMAQVNAGHRTIFDDETTVQVEWTADGEHLVGATREGSLHIRDADGESLRRIQIPGIRRFALSPSGDRVVAIAEDGQLSIWDVTTGTLVREIKTQLEPIAGVDWDPQGDRIGFTSKNDPRVQILSLSSDEVVSVNGPTGYFGDRVKFSPNGKYLAVCNSSRHANILDIRNRTWIPRKPRLRHKTSCVAWHPESRRFAEATDFNGLLLYDIVDASESLEDNKQLSDRFVMQLGVDETTIHGKYAMSDASFSKDGRHLMACGRSHRVDIYSVASKKVTWSLSGHLNATLSAVWHPTKSQVVSASLDGAVKFWELSPTYAYTERNRLRDEARNAGGVSRDGRWKWQRVTSTESLDALRRKNGTVPFRTSIVVFDSKTDVEVGRVELPATNMFNWTHTPIFFSNGNRMFVTLNHGTFPDAQALERNTSNGGIGFVYVLDTDSWNQIETFDAAATGYGAPNFALRGNVLVTCAEEPGVLRIFDFDKNTETRLRAHQDRMCLAQSLSGSRLATCSAGKITIWDTATWTEVQSFFGHDPNSPICSIIWGESGRYLATGSTDGTAIIWDTQNNSRLHTLQGSQTVAVLGFVADDSRLITASENVHVWDVSTGREIISSPNANRDLEPDEFRDAKERVRNMEDPTSQFALLDRATEIAEEEPGLNSDQPFRLDGLARELLHPNQPVFDPGRAVKLAREALALNPAHTSYRITLAWAQLRSGEVSGARETLEQITTSGESLRWEPSMLLAWCELQAGNREAALTAYELANSKLTPATFDHDLREICFEVASKILRKPNASADRIVVTTLDDEIDGIEDGTISLREAVMISQPGDQIEFAVEGEIPLWMGAIDIPHNVELVGPGHNKLTLSGLSKSRVLRIDDGDPEVCSQVKLSGLRFVQGNTPRRPHEVRVLRRTAKLGGGAIYSTEDLTITNAAFEENGFSVWRGGAICAELGASLEISHTTFAKNVAESEGAIWFDGSSRAVIDSCTFDSNESESTSAVGWSGTNEVQVRNCTFSNNKSSEGGTLSCQGLKPSIAHCTFTNNTTGPNGTIQFGFDKADASKNQVAITNCIIAGNRTIEDERLDFRLSENSREQLSLSHNIIGVLEGIEDADADNQIGVDAKLGPLAENGGLTKTHALLDGSPAIDAAEKTKLKFDQRGKSFNRSHSVGLKDSDASPDIGAYEHQG